MKTGITLLAAACAFALAACGDTDRPQTTETDPVASGPADTAPVDAAPADRAPTDQDTAAVDPAFDEAAPDPTADAGTTIADDAAVGEAAVVSDCSTTIEGNDRMQFNVDSIDIPADCSDFTITLEHTGQLPVAAMGHNVVVTTTDEYPGAAADGLSAGADAGYVQPDDSRVIAHTDMIGGGESTSVTFSTDSLDQGGDYTFFCSFPGHSALMSGSLTFGG